MDENDLTGADRDINDVFEDIAFPEGHLADEGFREGLPKGEALGKIDGYHLGYHRGLGIGAEIGFYRSVLTKVTPSVAPPADANDRLGGLLIKLRKSLDHFPCDCSESADIFESLNDVRVQFKRFYEPLSSLANSHIGYMFTGNIWNENVPEGIRRELERKESIREFIDLYPAILESSAPSEFREKHPNLVGFIDDVKELTITRDKRYSRSLTDLEKMLAEKGCRAESELGLNQFMSSKKLHEVGLTSRVTALLSGLTRSTHVIDVGGGKGYLSWVLVLKHAQKVLGLDVSFIKTCGAVKRSEKVAEIWSKGLLLEEVGANKTSRREYVRNRYRVVIANVTPETDLRNVIRENFYEETKGITLTGLHTCGNLSPTCLRMFVTCHDVKSIVNIGCCYHLIQEKVHSEYNDVPGFPMSRYLRDKGFALGANARMLAANSLERLVNIPDIETSCTRSMFYRAILETVMEEKGTRVQVGNLGKKADNFHDYMVQAVKKMNPDVQVTEEYTKRLYETYKELKPVLSSYFLIRVTLAPIIESIILLDRLLYLLENGIDNAYLVKIFDLKISPRGFALVAWKET